MDEYFDTDLIDVNRKDMEDRGYKVYPGIPWRRYFARCFDMQLAVAIIGTPIFILLLKSFDQLALLSGSIYLDQIFWCIGFLSCIIYLFIEALIMKLFGTTFGKFSFGIYMLTSSYDRSYTYGQLLKRDFLMFLKGTAFNIPVANIITMFVAKQYVEEDKSGQASWDYDCGFLVSYKRLGRINYFLIVVNILISLSILIGSLL